MYAIYSFLFRFLTIWAFLALCTNYVQAIYIPVYTTNDNGGISFTGNTLGLNKASNANQPGTLGSIGAFTSLNTSLKVGNFPAGTTLNWTQNGSSAVLDLPPSSVVLHAELIWSGSYGFEAAISGALLNTPITFITPDNVAHTITPNPLTAQSRVNTGTNGFYVRSADVTNLVSAGGTYSVNGVPATIGASENNLNCAGWTLAVVYRNPNMLTSNLTIFVACEASGAAPAVVSGFHAPDNGVISSRLFVSTLEGDAQIVGDHFLVGNTPVLTYPADGLSGTNNPSNNFFASQINTLLPLTTDVTSGKLRAQGSSLLDQRGTFGTLNSNASTGVGISGARQGYDITSSDLADIIVNGQEQIYAQGTTTGDVYTVNAVGIQVQVFAPIIVSQKQVSPLVVNLNDTVTYTLTFTNIGESTANSLVLKDLLPTGIVLNPNTFTINGVPFANPDLINGVPLGNLALNQTITVEFQASVLQIYPPISYENAATIDYVFIPFNSQTPASLLSRTNTATINAATIPPPIANPDTGVTNANTPLNASATLTNDSGTNLTITAYDNVTSQNGTVTMQVNGIYVYTPPLNFSGIDTFTYTVIDSANQTATTTVTITVLPVALNDAASVGANTTLSQPISVLNNDTGTNLVVSNYSTTSAQGGSVTMQPNGTYLYTPPLNFSGMDTFWYTATDAAGNSVTSTVRITVLPIAENDVGRTPANTPLNGSTVFTNDVGTGITLVSYDAVSIQGGTVAMNATDGTYTYSPPLNFSGIDTFTYTVADQQGGTRTATVTITVLPLAFNDSGVTNANTPFIQSSSVILNDAGTGLNVTNYATTSLQGGSVVMQSDGTYTYTPPLNFSGFDRFSYTVTDTAGNSTTALVILTVLPVVNNNSAITPANTTLIGDSVLINSSGTGLSVSSFQTPSTQGGTVAMNTDGTYTYVPPLNFSGIDTFGYVTVDSSGNTASATVTINVLPTATLDVGSTNANVAATGNVLNNDIGSGLTITTYQTTSARGGQVTMDAAGNYVYTPLVNFSGVDTFTYTATDTAGNSTTTTVTITVLPTAILDVDSTNANVAATGSVLSNDLGTGLIITNYQATSAAGGQVIIDTAGNYLYTPPLNFSGIDTFTYTATDSSGNSTTTTVTINVFPIAALDVDSTTVNVAATGNVLSNDLGSGLSVTTYQTTSAAGGQVTMDTAGNYVYTPPLNFSGTDTFTYTATDSVGNSTTTTVTISVLPTATLDVDSTNANVAATGNVLSNDLGSGLSVTAYQTTSAAGGQVTIDTAGNYVYTPPLNFSGIDTFTYTATDSTGNSTTNTVTINVLPLSNLDVNTTTANVAATGNVLSNDIGSGLSVTTYQTTSAAGGQVTINLAGNYVYTPPLNFSGIDTFTYTATDNAANSTTTTVTITVLPTATLDTNITNVNLVATGNVLSNDLGSGLTVTAYQTTSAAGGQVTINPAGNYVYTPPLNFSGIDTFTYTINDATGNSSTATVTVRVLPIATNDQAITNANQSLTGNVLLNDVGTSLAVTNYVAVSTAGGRVVIAPSGFYVYTPPVNFSGVDSFTYTVTDAGGNQTIATVFITVLPSAIGNKNFTTAVNVPLTGINVLQGNIGVGLHVTQYNQTSVQGGKVVIAPNGELTYIPPLNFTGTDSFTYIAVDVLGNSITGTITIFVQPGSQTLPNYTTKVNTPLNGTGLLANNPGNGAQIIANQTTSSQGGSVTIQPNGTFTYIPPPNFVGTDSFTYTIRDALGNLSQQVAVIIIVTATIEPPTHVIGRIKKYRFLSHTDYHLTLTWQPSAAADVVSYRIYEKNHVVAEVKANSTLKWSICLSSENNARKYRVVAVNRVGEESLPVNVRIINE